MHAADRHLVLTYHSISEAAGPTSVPTDVFAMQMAALADCGYSSVTVDDFQRWHRGEESAEDRRVLITFDDAFEDFREAAAPIMARHGFTAVVFVPTARIGGDEQWVGANAPARPLMSWDEIRALDEAGFEFGAHSLTHANLPKLDPQARETEIRESGEALAQKLGKRCAAFAAPYGAVDAPTVEAISRHYDVAFGTRLAISRRTDDRFDLPRLDMHYFRTERWWRSLLEGGTAYLTARQMLRAVRQRAATVLH